jgi:5-methyltetrahydrofolate--homocysteine methyltransferase
MTFLEALRSGRPIVMDGAMGTELLRAGLPQGQLGELWNIMHPDKVADIHNAYVTSGASVVLTNTFRANPETAVGYSNVPLTALIRAAVEIARASNAQWVLGDIGPMANLNLDFDSWIASFAGVDGLLVETQSDWRLLDRVRDVVRRVLPAVPIFFSVSFLHAGDGRLATIGGDPPKKIALVAAQHGIAVLGSNCGRGITLEDMSATLAEYRTETDLPLFVRPNAGTPTWTGGSCIYPASAEQMAACVPDLVRAGASMIGGCCGTRPEHIQAVREALARGVD